MSKKYWNDPINKRAGGFKISLTDAMSRLVQDSIKEIKAGTKPLEQILDELFMEAYTIGNNTHQHSSKIDHEG